MYSFILFPCLIQEVFPTLNHRIHYKSQKKKKNCKSEMLIICIDGEIAYGCFNGTALMYIHNNVIAATRNNIVMTIYIIKVVSMCPLIKDADIW